MDITLLAKNIEEKSFHIVVTNKPVQHESHNKDRMMTLSSELTCLSQLSISQAILCDPAMIFT